MNQQPLRRRMTVGGEIATRRTPVRTARPTVAARPTQKPPVPAQHTTPTVAPVPEPADHLRKGFQPPVAGEQKRTLYQKVQLPLVVILGIIAGVLVQSPHVGQLLIVSYVLVALMFRVESRNTFILGILSLITTVVMVAMQHNGLLGHTFAGYTLLIFLIGIVSAAREVRDHRTLTTKKRVSGRRY